jgi:hypothetical protein
MDVELIRIPEDAARAKLREYRKAIAARAHAEAARATVEEWRRIEAGYEAAAKGYALIELSKAMARGGWDDQGRPRFAVSRANKPSVTAHIGHNSELCFSSPNTSCWHRAKTVFHFPLRAMPPRPDPRRGFSGRAIVPMVPPDKLPRPDADLSRRVILWEADWTAPPVDPLLLLPIGGDLYAVEAAWDLTPLERAILTDRLT